MIRDSADPEEGWLTIFDWHQMQEAGIPHRYLNGGIPDDNKHATFTDVFRVSNEPLVLAKFEKHSCRKFNSLCPVVRHGLHNHPGYFQPPRKV